MRAGKLTRWGDVDNQQLVSRGVARNASCNLVCLLRVADLLSLTSCVRTYEWLLICRRANDAISPLLREGGLRNDAARAAL